MCEEKHEEDSESHSSHSHVDLGCRTTNESICALVNPTMSIVDDRYEGEVVNLEACDDATSIEEASFLVNPTKNVDDNEYETTIIVVTVNLTSYIVDENCEVHYLLEVEIEAIEVDFDNEHPSHEEWLQMLRQKRHIIEFIFGKRTLIGTTNQVDDNQSIAVKPVVETIFVNEEDETKEELEVVNTLKDFDEELMSIGEWIEKPKYNEKYQYSFLYEYVFDVVHFFRCTYLERKFQPIVVEEEEEEEGYAKTT